MAKKPKYVGTLNAIANGERGGYELFKRWAEATPDDALKPVLETVAIREAEHSWAFEKRLCELGYPMRETENPGLSDILKLAGSDASDARKFAALGIGSKKTNDSGPDRLLNLLADKTIDPQTGELLGRFICEERDSGRMLRKAYKAMKKRNKARKRAAKKAA